MSSSSVACPRLSAQKPSHRLFRLQNLFWIACIAVFSVFCLSGCGAISSLGSQSGGNQNSPSSVTAAAGSGQFVPISTSFSTAPQVTVEDSSGKAAPNATVTFTAPSSGASGTFSGGNTTATATTDSNGNATSPAFTANGTAGSYSVVASVSGATGTASFNLTNTDVSGNWSYAFALADGSTASGTLTLAEQGTNITGTIDDPGSQVGTITGTAGPNGALTANWNFKTLMTSATSCQSVAIVTTSIKCPPDIPCFGDFPVGYGGPLTGASTITNVTTGSTCAMSNQGGVSLIFNPPASPGLSLTGSWLVEAPGGQVLATVAQNGQNVTGTSLDTDGTVDSMAGTISGTAINFTVTSPSGCVTTVVGTEASDGDSFSGTYSESGSSCQTLSGNISATRL